MLNNKDSNGSRYIVATINSPSGSELITQSNLNLKATENYLFLFKFCVRNGGPCWSSNYNFRCCGLNWTDSIARSVQGLGQMWVHGWISNSVNRLSLGICTHTAPYVTLSDDSSRSVATRP